jgi:RimJ/RimL family protein N-acetyltransferase
MNYPPEEKRIELARLVLRNATAAMIGLELDDRPRFERCLGARVPADWPPEILAGAVPIFQARLESEPDLSQGWLAWYVILKDDGGSGPVLIGNCGFKGPPDPDGLVEISYSVLAAYQNRGYGSEAVAGVLAWAFAHAEVSCVAATTYPELRPSVRLLEKLGFQYVGAGPSWRAIRYLLTRPRYGRMKEKGGRIC